MTSASILQNRLAIGIILAVLLRNLSSFFFKDKGNIKTVNPRLYHLPIGLLLLTCCTKNDCV